MTRDRVGWSPRRVASAVFGLVLASWTVASCAGAEDPGTVVGTRPGTASTLLASPAVRPLQLEVVARHPHDTSSYTQGLVVTADGTMFESGGRYGSSTLREVDLATGAPTQLRDLPDEVFAEGLALVGDRLVQLTWKEGRAFIWDVADLEVVEELRYPGEGWGLCDDGERLVMSDGSASLTFRDRDTLAELGRVPVLADGLPVPLLNELECVDGMVWANVYQTDSIVQIDPTTGAVVAQVDASGLLTADEAGEADVLNGIAAVPGGDTFFITGKDWPWLYEVRFVPA